MEDSKMLLLCVGSIQFGGIETVWARKLIIIQKSF